MNSKGGEYNGKQSSTITVHGLIDNQISNNTAKQRTVYNDSPVHNLEFSFDGNLTTGQVLTLEVKADNTLCKLVTGLGHLACEVSLLKM